MGDYQIAQYISLHLVGYCKFTSSGGRYTQVRFRPQAGHPTVRTLEYARVLILDGNSGIGAHARKEQSLILDLFKAFD